MLGCIRLALPVLALLLWQRRRGSQPKDATDTLLNLPPAHKEHRGKSETPLNLMETPSSSPSPDRRASSVLWDDEVVISWRVPREKIVLDSLINRGGYGDVYKGTYNGEQVAIKTLLPETKRNLKHVRAFIAEVKMMAALEHSHIVQFVGVAWDSISDLCVLSEFMTGGDLRALLVHYEATQHTQGFDHSKVKIALHIAHALTYLHSLPQPVIHRDLKSKNVLLTPGLDAKLTDFGVSRKREDCTMTVGVGTSLWMAPEVMTGKRYDTAADMFSFGVVLSELDVHTLPYSHAKENGGLGRRMPDPAILRMIAASSLHVEFSPQLLPEVVELGCACVSIDPKQRPTAPEALYQLQTMLHKL